MVDGREYRGTIALRHALTGPGAEATALALTCWSDSFALHGIEPLPTPPPPWPVVSRAGLEATTDAGSVHHGGGSGGHGVPRFLWHLTFTPALPPDVRTLTLSGRIETGGITTRLELPHWPPTRYDALAEATTSPPSRAPRRPAQTGESLPDRVVALSADLGSVAGARCALTSLSCWPSWFMLTVEAVGAALRMHPRESQAHSWEMEDDRGNEYLGAWTGGWSGADSGSHIAFGPGLDPDARQLRLSFTNPFGQAGGLTTVVTVPDR